MSDNTNTDLEGVMRRVHKLLAIANDERANPAEAAAAASQAEKIMRKYQIDHLDLMKAEFKKATNFDFVDCAVRMKMHNPVPPKIVPLWAQFVATEVAKLHDVQARQARTSAGTVIRFSGFKMDAEVAAWTFDYLVRNIINNCREFQREMTREKSESNSYRMGFVKSINRSLIALRKQKEDEAKTLSSGRELMIVKAQAIAEHFGEVRYKEKAYASPQDAEAFTQGLIDGKKIDVARRAVSHNPDSVLRIGK